CALAPVGDLRAHGAARQYHGLLDAAGDSAAAAARRQDLAAAVQRLLLRRSRADEGKRDRVYPGVCVRALDAGRTAPCSFRARRLALRRDLDDLALLPLRGAA